MPFFYEPSGNPSVVFHSTSTMPSVSSSLYSGVYTVGAPRPHYVGVFRPAYALHRIPGTGGVNPPDYDPSGGTGFKAPMGSSLTLLFFALVYTCIKKCSKLYRRL